MKRFILSIILIVALATPSHALFYRVFTSLTGQVAGSIDNAYCVDTGGVDGLGDGTDDGVGIVIMSDGTFNTYFFDRSDTSATSSPNAIRCRGYTTSGVWLLQPNFKFASDCSSITSGICFDIDDGQIYVWDGDSVEGGLVGDLDVGAFKIESTTGNIVLKLPDAAGTYKVSITDSGDVEIWNIDSDGVQNKQTAAAWSTFVAGDSTCADDVAGRLIFTVDGNGSDVSLQTCVNSALVEIATYDESNARWTFPGLSFQSVEGQGIGFYSTAAINYGIYMGTTATYGSLDSTSGYNIYFDIIGGTNRGFVFMNGTTPVAQIDAGGNFFHIGNNVPVPETEVYTVSGDLSITAGTVLLDGDNDGTAEILDLQNGTNPGEEIHLIAHADIDSTGPDSCTIATMTDTTCTNCPAIVFDEVGENAKLTWTGTTWVVSSLIDNL